MATRVEHNKTSMPPEGYNGKFIAFYKKSTKKIESIIEGFKQSSTDKEKAENRRIHQTLCKWKAKIESSEHNFCGTLHNLELLCQLCNVTPNDILVESSQINYSSSNSIFLTHKDLFVLLEAIANTNIDSSSDRYFPLLLPIQHAPRYMIMLYMEIRKSGDFLYVSFHKFNYCDLMLKKEENSSQEFWISQVQVSNTERRTLNNENLRVAIPHLYEKAESAYLNDIEELHYGSHLTDTVDTVVELFGKKNKLEGLLFDEYYLADNVPDDGDVGSSLDKHISSAETSVIEWVNHGR